ncbi:MAG TPA: hypothetical protein ENK18_22935 [Deltaproteobacteria bacterium]|nr:hypothetical protein [Deltaproteobacteria bacterium]
MTWSCLHVYYGEPQDRLLCEAVAPLVLELRSGLRGWFFLRYWMGGPHLRLRFALDPDGSGGRLEAIQGQLEGYIERHPCPLLEQPTEPSRAAYASLAALEGLSDAEASASILQNCVQPMPYEPELAKYGGEAGVAIAEELFVVSSDISLEVIAATHRSARLGRGLEMMVAGILAAGHDEASCGAFLAEVSAFWSRYTSESQRRRWDAQLQAQLASLVPRVERLFSRRSEHTGGLDDPVLRWAQGIRVALARVDGDPEVLSDVRVARGPVERARRRDYLLLNYLHTHNNRLGIIPAYESYLAFLGHHAICRSLGAVPVT